MAIESHMNDPVMRTLAELNAAVERGSAERRAARQQATQAVMQGAQERMQQQEDADAQELAVSMTGREGQDYAKAHPRNIVSRTAQEGTSMLGKRDEDGIRTYNDDSDGLEPEDLDALAASEEENMAGAHVQSDREIENETALQQRKDRYKRSEEMPDEGPFVSGTPDERNLTRARVQAANEVRGADGLADVLRQMSMGFTSRNPGPQAQAPASPEKQRMLAALGLAGSGPAATLDRQPLATTLGASPMAPMTPEKARMLQALDAAQRNPYGGGGPSPMASQLDAAMAPAAQLAAMPPAPMPVPTQPMMQPPTDPGFAAFMASRGVR